MASEWRDRTIGELTENFDSVRVPVKGADRRAGPYPYYGASGIVDHVDKYLFDGEYLLVAEDGENLRTRNTPVAFLASGRFWVNNHAHIVRGNHDADTRFLMYALNKLDISGYLTGSTMPKLTQGNLNRIPILAPPIEEQRAVADVLSTLDNKIELNRLRNETLQATAQALFKSWFVEFDPVRAKCEGRSTGLPRALTELFPKSLVQSALGQIPEGWVVGSVDDEFFLTMGQSPPGETYNETGEGFPFYQGRSDFSFRYPVRRVYCTAPTRFAKTGDTLISVRAPVGDINMASEDCAIGRGLAAARHKAGSRSYTYQFMHSIADTFAKFEGEGTVFGSISKKDFHAIECLRVPWEIVLAFESIVAPVDDRIDCGTREMATLAAIRDTLMPRLMSGELRIVKQTPSG